MHILKTLIVAAAMALTTAPALVHAESAATFPTKTMHVIVPTGPGGGYDYIGRILGEALAKELGQPVVVENRSGAGTVIGTQHVVRSAPDGYTMVVGGTSSIAQATALVKDLPYSPAKDLVPLQLVSTSGYVLSARTDFGPKNLKELIAYARANPGKLSIGSPGQGTGQAVAAAMLKSMAGIDVLEVQYKGASAAYIDLISGRIDLFFDTTGTALPFLKSGKIRAIVSSGSVRDLPDVPTAKESGLPDLVLVNWTGLFVPAATPRPIVLRLRQAIDKVVATPEFKKQNAFRNFEGFSSPDVDAFVKSETLRWPPILVKAGLLPQ